MAKFRDIELFLLAQGILYLYQAGSHRHYRNQDGKKISIATHASKELPRPLLAKILKDFGFTLRDFFNK